MAIKRYLNTRFWTDGYISELDPSEKLLFIYFLTNSHTNICGIYEIPIKIIAVETGFEKSMIDKILSRFHNDKKIFYIDGWIVVKNFERHQAVNDSVREGMARALQEIPEEIIKKAHELAKNGQTGGRVGTACRILNLTKPNLTKPNSIAAGAARAKEPFNPDIAIARLMGSQKKHVATLGRYYDAKGTKFENELQYRAAVKRDVRAAKELDGYSPARVKEVMAWLRENANFKWTLETVHKYINENLELLGQKDKTVVIT